MYRNGFRRKGGKSDLAATLSVAPIALMIVGGLCFGAGATALWAAVSGHIDRVSWVLWAIFLLSQLANLNLGQPGSTFDPKQLIRFPMGVWSYTAVRLFFGILAPGNIIVTLMSMAAAVGVTIARPALAGWAFTAMAVFAVVNVLFTRMIFAWVDRWLSTRRAREAFTALIFLFSIAIQGLNFAYNPAYHHRRMDLRKVQGVSSTLAKVEHYVSALPPELAGRSDCSGSSRPCDDVRGEESGFGGVGMCVSVCVLAANEDGVSRREPERSCERGARARRRQSMRLRIRRRLRRSSPHLRGRRM